MRIAILGSRGIPAQFGGFETFAEQLAVRMVQRGLQVTVFCEDSQNFQSKEYKGVSLCHVRTPKIAGLRSIWGDLVAILRCLRGYDRVYMLGYHTAFVFFLPRLLGVDFWVNMDGLEWKRSKWSTPTRAYLRCSEALAAYLARHLVADSAVVRDYLTKAYPSCAGKVTFIPYGAVIPSPMGPEVLVEYGLESGKYDLVVCRLEPENHVREIIFGHELSRSQCPLLVVGDHTSGSRYVDELQSLAGDKVIFAGTIYDANRLSALRQHCRVYLHGHSVGGTNPSLLEAMACGNQVIAHDNHFNRDVLGDESKRYFKDALGVAEQIMAFESTGADATVDEALIERVRNQFSWERITDLYLEAFSAASAGNR